MKNEKAPPAGAGDKPWQDEEKLRELYVGRGLPASEIADRLGCSGKTVRNWLSRLGVERDVPWQDEQTLRELYIEEGHAQHEIATELGCDQGTVSKWLKEFNIPIRSQGHHARKDALWDETSLREMYVEEEMSTVEMAERLSCSAAGVTHALERFSIQRRSFSEANLEEDLAPLRDKQWIEEQYLANGRSAADIAAEVGCSKVHVLRILKNHGIPRRSTSLAHQENAPSALTDREALRELYSDSGLHMHEIADRIGCSTSTVHKWLHAHDIETRNDPPSGSNSAHWRGGGGAYRAVRTLIRKESWEETASRIRDRDNHTCQMCGEEKRNGRSLDVNHIPALLDGGCNADELLMSFCISCHNTGEYYLREATGAETHLRDWSDDELPEGRERWTPDARSGQTGLAGDGG